MSLTDVPHFVQDYPNGKWVHHLDHWLRQWHLCLIELRPSVKLWCYHIAVGYDGSACHSVVMFGNEIVHDPSPAPANSKTKNPMRRGVKPKVALLIVPLDIGRMRHGLR